MFFAFIACNTIIRFSIGPHRFPVDGILETKIEFLNITNLTSGTSAITFYSLQVDGRRRGICPNPRKGPAPENLRSVSLNAWNNNCYVCQRTIHKMHTNSTIHHSFRTVAQWHKQYNHIKYYKNIHIEFRNSAIFSGTFNFSYIFFIFFCCWFIRFGFSLFLNWYIHIFAFTLCNEHS